MSEERKIKSINQVEIVGTLVEVGNFVFDAEKKNSSNPKIVGAFTKTNFNKPVFVIDVNGQKIGASPLPTYKYTEKDGKIVENPRFKAMETVLNYEIGTRVKLDGSISVGNPYLSKTGKIIESVDVRMNRITSTGVPSDDYAQAKVSGVIKSIKPETTGSDDEETGRLAVDFYLYDDYYNSVSPVELIVENVDENDETVENFEDAFENGDCVVFDADIVSRRVGGNNVESKGFGTRKKSKIVNGYTKTEFSIFDGDTIDDESSYYIDEDTFKTLFKAHKQKCEEAKNATPNNDEAPKKKGLGSRKSRMVEVEEDDDDNPFDD